MDNLGLFLVVGSFLLGAFLALLFIKFNTKRGRSKKGNKIYLLGPQGCGKTRFLLSVSKSKDAQNDPPTVTSTAINEYQIGKYILVDTPGHPKLRPEAASFSETRLLVLWITEASLKSDIEYILSLLVHAHKHHIPLYIITLLSSKSIAAACDEAITRIIQTSQTSQVNVDLEYDLGGCQLFDSASDLSIIPK
jgi:GTPase SAR1 family protein